MTEPTTTDYRISGMTCEHCVMSVDEAFRELPGVLGVVVDLQVGGISTATVTSERPLGDAEAAAAVDDAGYALAEA
ncbi:cation transporter [Curtobacterium sp. MCBD17_035]|uniref:heavy-metal-associated domain-containing protein n=1 Tax=Curtobacterium sp. MCBD17_035 TaxID=2175673 RepID=UPI000DA9FA00|nr:cation transporter [Curtobacterium sp. MCBD17_035]WIB65987.1 cation transporter [Curtobacterium sp. MCBD17_035]